jgi:gas vesicle protein
MSDRSGGASGFVIGLVVGAAIGLAIGFLYAPRPGEETRAVIKEKVKEVRDRGTEVAGKAREAATEASKRVKQG